jgi:uncharacterized protein YndB with AHSA1/START domain
MDVTDTFDFNAPAEIVYSTLTDPDRAGRWFPAGTQITDDDAGHLRIRNGDRRIDLVVSPVPDELRLTVRCTEPMAFDGTARVTETPAGGSRIDVVVTAANGQEDPAALRDSLRHAMRHLQRDIDDNFTPG